MIIWNKASFITSAPSLDLLPPDRGIEVAFIGRSNAGKSSSINTITGIKNLAKTSKTPGRTQLMNCFDLGQDCRLVDLPGYGFAKVPDRVKATWRQFINDYLSSRACLKGLVLLMDCRHPLKEQDQAMLSWADNYKIPVLVLLTKSDKLKRGALMAAERSVKEALEDYRHTRVICFSSLKKTGVDSARKILLEWYQLSCKE